MKYAYLGPTGTFTESALQQIATAADELIPYVNVTATLDAVRNSECDRALVPIENSVEGVVARTLDELAIGQPLVITGEITLPVNFALMTLSDKNINEIKILDGVYDTLKNIKSRGHKICIVTNSNKQVANKIIDFININKFKIF